MNLKTFLQSSSNVLRQHENENHLEIQDHKASFQVKENSHSKCDMKLIDEDTYQCKIVNNMTTCTATCTIGGKYSQRKGIKKKLCQCYTKYQSVLIYE